MTPHDLTEFYIRTQRHGNTTACIQAANAAGAVVLVPTELEARRVRELGARAFSLSRGARELAGSSDAFVVDPTVLAVAAAEWSAQVSGLEVARDEATRALVDARAGVARLKAESDRFTAELAEALATLANERGEGEPPVPGFVATLAPERGDEYNPHEDVVVRWMRPWNGYSVIYVGTEADSHRWWWSIMGRTVDGKNVLLCRGDADTARAAIRDASAAKGLAK